MIVLSYADQLRAESALGEGSTIEIDLLIELSDRCAGPVVDGSSITVCLRTLLLVDGFQNRRTVIQRLSIQSNRTVAESAIAADARERLILQPDLELVMADHKLAGDSSPMFRQDLHNVYSGSTRGLLGVYSGIL